MRQHIHKGDISFALLLTYFLVWFKAFGIKTFSMLEVGRLAMSFLAIFVALEVMFALISYLRNKPLFGRTPAQYFDWKKVLPTAIIISGLYTLFNYFYLDSPISNTQIAVLIGGGLLGVVAILLYFYSLVKKPE